MKWTQWMVVASALSLAACSSDPSDENSVFQVSTDSGTSTSDAGEDAATVNNVVTDAATAMPDAASDTGTTVADMGTGDTAGADMSVAVDMPTSSVVYVGTGDPYQLGALAVTEINVPQAAGGPPVDVDVYVPATPGEYPVVVFQHGFSLLADYYSTMLGHVASHGFVVVAPQMYEPAFFGTPTAAEEAADAALLYAWIAASLNGVVAVDAATDLLGLAGHSRGAKVIWLALEAGFSGATAAAGVDPVDGTGGPLGNEARVLAGGLAANLPSLFLGTELGAELIGGQACAPTGDNYEAFYDAAPSPSYSVLGEGYGHLDMLNDQTTGCGLTCLACVDGPSDGAFRAFAAGQLVAFFRWQLQGDATAATFLTDTSGAPLTATSLNK